MVVITVVSTTLIAISLLPLCVLLMAELAAFTTFSIHSPMVRAERKLRQPKLQGAR